METSKFGALAVQITHLARNVLYQAEKPYAADFPVPGRGSNHIFEVKDILVDDARFTKDSFTLERNGFCLFESPISATFESLSSKESEVLAYYQQMEALVLDRFPEYCKIMVLEHQLRKRDVGYPEEVQNTYNQPARLVHRDFTTRGLFLRMKLSFPGQEKEYMDKNMDFLNIWRVLSSPNNDWPLGVCDYASIDSEKDTIPNDMLSRETVGENELLFASPGHKWCFLSNQNVEEAILFRNASTDPRKSYAFHAAFDTGRQDEAPRQSIELRMVAFRRAEQAQSA